MNSFITRKTRPRRIISDNATTFIATPKWIKLIRRSGRLHDYLASQDINWTFNLAKSPWWEGLYERLIKEIKTTRYKTLGKTHLFYDQLETVILYIDRHLNNRPLTYVESGQKEEQIVTPKAGFALANFFARSDFFPLFLSFQLMEKSLVENRLNTILLGRESYALGELEERKIMR